jgi:FkbM family methyltransferase
MINIKKNQEILSRRLQTILRNGEEVSIKIMEERLSSLGSGFMGIIPLKCGLGSFYYMDLGDDIVARHLLALGVFGYERGTAAAWTALAREADLVLDIGAFTGYFTLLADRLSKAKKIIAVEANPLNYQRLRENLLINNSSAQVINRALVPAGSSDGSSACIEVKYNSRLSSLDAGGFANHPRADLIAAKSTKEDFYRIDTLAIDALLSDNSSWCSNDRFLLVKLDVEGLELELLDALLDCKRSSFIAIIELLSDNAFRAAWHLLASRHGDYSIFYVDESALSIRSVDCDGYREFKRRGSRNFVICSSDSKHRVVSLDLSSFLEISE